MDPSLQDGRSNVSLSLSFILPLSYSFLHLFICRLFDFLPHSCLDTIVNLNLFSDCLARLVAVSLYKNSICLQPIKEKMHEEIEDESSFMD